MPTNAILSAMNERSTADDTQSRSANQRALQQAITFPLEQTMQFQSEAARFFVDSLESGSAAQQRGFSLATDLVRNYARTLERTTRDTAAFATASADAFQPTAIAGGQQGGAQRMDKGQQSSQPTQQASRPTQQMAQPTQQASQPTQRTARPTTAQQQAPPQQAFYGGQQQPQYEQQAPPQYTQQYEQQPQPQQQSPFSQPQLQQYGGQQGPSQSTPQAQQQYEQQPQQTTGQPLQRAPPQQSDQSTQTPERSEPSITQ